MEYFESLIELLKRGTQEAIYGEKMNKPHTFNDCFEELGQRIEVMSSMMKKGVDGPHLLTWAKGILHLVQKLEASNSKREDFAEDMYISAQQELESKRYKYPDYYEKAPFGYFILEENGLIREVNQKGANILGTSKESLAGTHFLSSIVEHYQVRFSNYCSKIFTKQTGQVCEMEMIKKDGTIFFAELESIPIPNKKGDTSQFRIILRDITNKKLMEKALKYKETMTTINTVSNYRYLLPP